MKAFVLLPMLIAPSAALAEASLPPLPQNLEEAVAGLMTGIPANKWKRIDDHTVGLPGLGSYSVVTRDQCVVDWKADRPPPNDFVNRSEYRFNDVDKAKIRVEKQTDSDALILEGFVGARVECDFYQNDDDIKCRNAMTLRSNFPDDSLRENVVKDAVFAIYKQFCRGSEP